jgi:hypothetical protein
LSRRGVVKIHQRLAVNRFGQYGKIFSVHLDICFAPQR